MRQDTDCRYTVVIPLYREEDNVDPLLKELVPIMEGLGDPFEILIVDDGSDDGTPDALRSAMQGEPRLRVLTFRKNHGQSAALDAGFQHARGEVIITMDGDMQCDPAAIPEIDDPRPAAAAPDGEAIELELESFEDLDVIANLELLEAFVALDGGTG